MFGLLPASRLHAKQASYITTRYRINTLHHQVVE